MISSSFSNVLLKNYVKSVNDKINSEKVDTSKTASKRKIQNFSHAKKTKCDKIGNLNIIKSTHILYCNIPI